MPDAWENGVGADPPLVLSGEHAHYAVTRAVGELGLGLRSVRTIPSLDFRMEAAALRAALEGAKREGRSVMAVVATAGSTATGSFDDLESIGRLCAEHDVWLHVDGAHGAAALLSRERRGLLAGLHLARSIAWDPHKMMLLPLSAGVVLVRDGRDLDAAFAQRAPYLFHGRADGGGNVDQGVRSFQCSRRADVLKVWAALQRYGADAIGVVFDHLCSVARAMWGQILARHDFVALHEPSSNILCFRWVGDGSLDAEALDLVNLELRERYNRSGEGWLTTTVLGGRRVLRVTIMNPRTTEADVRDVLDGLARVAAALPGG